jgi:hypothetical protein
VNVECFPGFRARGDFETALSLFDLPEGAPCQEGMLRLKYPRFWKGGESLSAEQSSGGGKSEHRRARCRVTCSCQRKKADFGIHAGEHAVRRLDGKCHREQTADLKFQMRFQVGKGEKVG